MIQFNSNFIAGYIQLLKTSFGIQDWDAVNSSATWLVSACPGYYDAYVYLALEALFSGKCFLLFYRKIIKIDDYFWSDKPELNLKFICTNVNS